MTMRMKEALCHRVTVGAKRTNKFSMAHQVASRKETACGRHLP